MRTMLDRATARLGACLSTLAMALPAQAGYVSGDFDPLFGAALPGMRWGAHVELLVPNNACLTHNGVQAIAGDCAGVTILGAWVRMYDTGLPAPDWTQSSTYFSNYALGDPSPRALTYSLCDASVNGNPNYAAPRCINFGTWFTLNSINLNGGQLIGLDAAMLTILPTSLDLGAGPESVPFTANSNVFKANFLATGPELVCTTCPGGPITSDPTDLSQFVVTYTSNDSSTPSITDSNGNALGVRLDGRGNVLGLSTSITGAIVPEPAGIALTFTALAAAAVGRRRRR